MTVQVGLHHQWKCWSMTDSIMHIAQVEILLNKSKEMFDANLQAVKVDGCQDRERTSLPHGPWNIFFSYSIDCGSSSPAAGRNVTNGEDPLAFVLLGSLLYVGGIQQKE